MGKRLNPNSPLTEQEQRGMHKRIALEMAAYADLQRVFSGGPAQSARHILKLARRLEIRRRAREASRQRLIESIRSRRGM